MRPFFELLNEALLGVSDTAQGELTTIYIKYVDPEIGSIPYGVLWIKRATELILGLPLPDDIKHPKLVVAPPGCKYAGLTKYLVLQPGDQLPEEIDDWCQQAYEHIKR